jgi:hypothetical protein
MIRDLIRHHQRVEILAATSLRVAFPVTFYPRFRMIECAQFGLSPSSCRFTRILGSSLLLFCLSLRIVRSDLRNACEDSVQSTEFCCPLRQRRCISCFGNVRLISYRKIWSNANTTSCKGDSEIAESCRIPRPERRQLSGWITHSQSPLLAVSVCLTRRVTRSAHHSVEWRQ